MNYVVSATVGGWKGNTKPSSRRFSLGSLVNGPRAGKLMLIEAGGAVVAASDTEMFVFSAAAAARRGGIGTGEK